MYFAFYIVVFKDAENVFIGISVVDGNGKTKFTGQLQLFSEIFFLSAGVRMVFVSVVHTYLTDGNNLFVFAHFSQRR